jgi:translocator protein
MRPQSILKLVISIALPLVVGAIAGSFTSEAIPNWYATLNRPSFNPPNWLFAPVWTCLYILPPSKGRNKGLLAFGIQLALNFTWSFLFFYFKTMGIALVEIIVLWGCILIMIVLFYRMKPWAGYINIPYIMWVSFATILNAAYYSLN